VTRISVVDGLGPHSPRLCGATSPHDSLRPRLLTVEEVGRARRAAGLPWFELQQRRHDEARALALEHLSFEELLAMAFEKFQADAQPWNEQA
jgi:hypothetical protein